MTPSRTQIAAAVETLVSAGWRMSPPAEDRLRLLDPRQVADLVGVGLPRAREIITSIPTSIRLPGGELRARIPDLERWIDQHAMSAPTTLSR
jgi:hypothetical protein